MPTALEQVTKEAMDLSLRQKLALAEFLLESADAAADPEAEAAWVLRFETASVPSTQGASPESPTRM